MLEKVKSVFKDDALVRYFLASLFVTGIGYGIYKGIIDNYFAEIVGIGEFDRGVVEFFRELPGLILVVILAVFYMSSAEKLYKAGAIIMLATGAMAATDLLASMGSGAAGMFETSMVAILVSSMCALIKDYGGFDTLLAVTRKLFKGSRSGQLGVGLLVGLMDIATANNTVAIVMANPIAREMAGEYGISARKTASLLDTFSCIFQGILPYGAQMLVAISACAALEKNISAFEIIPNLFYPFLLLISSLLFIVFSKKSVNAK